MRADKVGEIERVKAVHTDKQYVLYGLIRLGGLTTSARGKRKSKERSCEYG